ncbi:ABC transporter ATP-binding protein [Desulforhabdus amnigena]|jgi:branched-chain amino acid transport system ATP-binding protein|uniref:ABC transporter ATP-binding protein n=1 Tax=Desulforhabdus amnigena TaxID=40218 RepID=A0A9W6D0W2_9BACT|nr:ABC transporter ATP-binding protein [Desulforhabdus amnigena]NLJ27286.1 ABC transporter ATP-binding protein [Deltaproteobacteria bacterium]GLI32934.1 ABC transporter ATP-binding protein [Desulforhabdus amnigena]
MLRVEHVDAGYGDVQVLWDVSFKVDAGEFAVLVGANGAGKSTIMKTISNLVQPSRGEIWFEETRLNGIPPNRIIDLGIAHVPEGRQLFPEMTVRENLELGSLTARAKSHRKQSMEWVMELFPRLRERQKQLAGTLSGGEQQMCAIARGLMSRPKMVLFDEPSLGLSPLLTQDIFRLTHQIHQEGLTILMVEQNVKQTLTICDRAYVLTNGKIVMEGKGRELLENQEVKEAFLGI